MQADFKKERKKNSAIGLTGASGFIGQNILKKINARPLSKRTLPGWPKTIIHCGWAVRGTDDQILKNITYSQRIFSSTKARIIFISSCNVNRGNPKTIEGVAKLAVEKLLKIECQDFLTIRPLKVYGEHSIGRPYLVTRAIEAALLNKELVIHDENAMADFVYIEDVVSCISRSLEIGERGKIYTSGTGIRTSVGELVELVEKISNKKIKKIKGHRKSPQDTDCLKKDIDRTDKQLGIIKKTKLSTGLEKTIRWFDEFCKNK